MCDMDRSYEIRNSKGDLLRIALSCYDAETVGMFTSDALVLSVEFYDVTLIRESGSGGIGYRALNTISESLAVFLDDNPDAVLCFYCDDQTEIDRRNLAITPQEYRSDLFSRMYDRYIALHGINWLVNHKVRIEIGNQPRITHFICRKENSNAISAIGDILINVKP